MQEPKVTWYESTQPPDLINARNVKGHSFSAEVLIYSASKKTHSIAFYDYTNEKWVFLIREPPCYFRWRYFDKETDEYLIKKAKAKK